MNTIRRTATVVVCLVALVLASSHRADANTVAGGVYHSVVVKPDGTVWTWGDNSQGQLADGTTVDRRVPGQVSGITDAVAVAAGTWHTLVLRADGSVVAWGGNGDGQLGDGTYTLRRSPVPVSGLTSVIAIAAGSSHSVALTSDGRVWTWGRNALGQLGEGTAGSTQPLLVTTLTSVTAISAGHNHTLAVRSDGTAWSWGYNYDGQLGDGSLTQRSTPVAMTGVSDAVAVAGGGSHSLVLKTNGSIVAAGSNTYQQLGDATYARRTTAVPVSTLSNVVQIAGSWRSSYARRSDGTLWAWGDNSCGQLGDGTTTTRGTPVQLASIPGGANVAGGNETHFVAVTTAGVVWTGGCNQEGKLGDGTDVTRISPVAISGPDYDWKVSRPVFSVTAGTYTTVKTVVLTAVTPDAAIHYTLDGNTPTEADPSVLSGGTVTIDQSQTLSARAFKSGMPPSDVTAAVYTLAVAGITFSPTPATYTAAQTVTLSTSSPGATIRYTLDGSTPTVSSALYTAPLSIGHTTIIKAIGLRTNWTSSAVVTGTFTMNFGTLAKPTFSPAPGTYDNDVSLTLTAMPGATIRHVTDPFWLEATSPIYVAPIAITSAKTIKAGAFHPDYTWSGQASGAYTFVVAPPVLSHPAGTYTAGQVVTITTATQGAVLRYTLNGATPTTNDPVVPAAGIVVGNFTLKVAGWKTGYTPSSVVTAIYQVTGSMTSPLIAAGDNHSVAVRADGTVWTWGYNGGRELGDGTTTNRTLPVLIDVSGAAAVTAGFAHSAGRRPDGVGFSWGYNGYGQLGEGSTATYSKPITMTVIADLVAVAAGSYHTLALKTDGTVWGFGQNSSGQLGDATTTLRLTAVQASGLTGVTAIAAGVGHSVALKGDGSVWTWGQNGNGQLGSGNTTNRSTPGQVGSLSAVAIATRAYHTLALLADGTVRGWGSNGWGQLGNGSTAYAPSPVAVSGLTSVTAIAAGGQHSLALKSDGTVWGWGYNGVGQLGDGTTATRTVPVQVQGLPTIVAIAAGANHSLGVDTDGGVWAWGLNYYGQLGDGTTTNRLLPLQIATAGMTWKIPTPVLSLVSGLYTTEQNVTVTNTDPTAVLHYTTDGTNPTTSHPVVASGGTVAIPQSLTLKVRAWKPGSVASEVATGTYQLKAIAPTFSPSTGQYASSQNVAISTATSAASIRYTTDGTEPTPTSSAYAGTIAVADTRTLKARAYKTGWTPSDSVAASYAIYAGTVATPTMTPAAGPFIATPLVTLATATPGATIRYTTDGSEPSWTSAPYQFPLLVAATRTIKARAFVAGMLPSAVASGTYALDPSGQTDAPAIVPGGGRFATQQTVTITGEPGATLRYTTTGVDPTLTDPLVPANGEITVDRAQIVKVRAWLAGELPSAVRRADFLITGAVAAGTSHSLALASDGRVWAWGRHFEGQVGNGYQGSDPLTSPPTAVLTDGISIAGGREFSVAARRDGTVWAWGDNYPFGLGTGSTHAWTPAQVQGLSNVTAVAAGAEHFLALKTDGTVWTWGKNASGQLGDGTTTDRATPVQVLGLRGITSIAAGEDFSLAVQADGGGGGFLWTWGGNTHGQLGDGSILDRSVPVRVPGITTAVHVSAGRGFAVVTLGDGSVRVWGLNDYGQLATLSGASSSTPMPVPAAANIVKTSSGLQHTLALDPDGRTFGWGNTTYGQLGVGQYSGANGVGAPLLVPGLSGAVDIAAGAWHSLFLGPDGAVWATGSHTGAGLPADTKAVQPLTGVSLAPNGWLLTDADQDGLPAWREYLAGLDPLNRDTNGNGLSDLVDLRRQAQSANPDDDGDGVPNAIEQTQGTDPFSADSDGDGVSDSVDDYPLDPTRTQKPGPTPGDTTPPVIILTQPSSARPVGGQ